MISYNLLNEGTDDGLLHFDLVDSGQDNEIHQFTDSKSRCPKQKSQRSSNFTE